MCEHLTIRAGSGIFHVYSIQWLLSTVPCRYELVKTRAVFVVLKLAKCGREYTANCIVYTHVFLVIQGPYTESASVDCTESDSVVRGVLSLIIILIIGGSALGFTILILKLQSEKQ